MKKKLLLCVICLILSGCTTEVTLKIDSEKVTETIKVFEVKDKVYFNGDLDENIRSNLEVFEREYEFYDMNEYQNEDYVGKTYELTENLELWSELSHIRPCYETFKLEKTDTNITLNTSEEYRCGYLFGANDVTFVVESDLELISSNADKVEDNKLIWNIDNNNYKNKSISFNYKIDSTKEMNLQNYIIYILFAIFSLGIIIFVFIKTKNKKSNEI